MSMVSLTYTQPSAARFTVTKYSATHIAVTFYTSSQNSLQRRYESRNVILPLVRFDEYHVVSANTEKRASTFDREVTLERNEIITF